MKNTTIRNLLATGLVGAVALGSSSLIAQDIPAPKDVAAAPADAQVTKSGLKSRVLKKGTGKVMPSAVDTVTVHYTGWDKTGKMFDSSVKRGEPSSFPLNQVIKGWTEGLQLMVEGEKRRFWIPAEAAYGENPGGGRPGGDLTFDVELINIKKAPEMPEVPKDVAAPPKDAEKTESGLASKVLKKGTGTIKPKSTDNVSVHYSGWDAEGRMFDSSVMRGEPTSFPLNQVIKGWTEGVQMMVEGEKRRFWIPAELAYGKVPERPGAPAGDLTFDVELLKVISMPDAPKNLTEIPEDAMDSDGGVKSIVLKEGKGPQPKMTDIISVNYTGWSPDGEIIDSSVPLGKPVTLSLAELQERTAFVKALQMLKVGEIRQIWIPVKEIVGENPPPGAPEGMFCYQFELVEIVLDESAE